MLGLFGTLNLGQRSLQAQRQGVEVAGHNVANVNNPAYTRQRIDVRTSSSIQTPFGPQGTGVDVVAVQQLRNHLAESHLITETSVTGSLQAQQEGLQMAQTHLGQQIDRHSAAEGAAAAQNIGAQLGLTDAIAGLFSAFQSVSANPTSLADRQVLAAKAQNLATQFNQIDDRLTRLSSALDASLASDAATATQLLGDVAQLNEQIVGSEANSTKSANDLRDLRQQKLEQLAKIVQFNSTHNPNGAIDINIAGQSFVTGPKVESNLLVSEQNGKLLVRSQTNPNPLPLTGGRLHGTIAIRDGTLADLRKDLDNVASLLVSEINAVHRAGFSLAGSTGADFFQGASAKSIQTNPQLLASPQLIQASGAPGAVGDNQVALALAQLAEKPHPTLQGQTFLQSYNQSVVELGQTLASVNNQIENQAVVEGMLRDQRDATSGVSLDEEMTNLVRFQKAYEASARLISTVDEMLDTIMNMKR